MSEQEIEALLRLMDDPNPKPAEAAQALVVGYGAAALPALQTYADHHPRLAGLVTQRIEAQLLEAEWAQLAQRPDAEAAALLIARWLDPLIFPTDLMQKRLI